MTMLVRVAVETDVDCGPVAGRYSLLDSLLDPLLDSLLDPLLDPTALTDLLPACARRDIAVFVSGVFDTGRRRAGIAGDRGADPAAGGDAPLPSVGA